MTTARGYKRSHDDHLVEAALYLREARDEVSYINTLTMSSRQRAAVERAIEAMRVAADATAEAINALGGPLRVVRREEPPEDMEG